MHKVWETNMNTLRRCGRMSKITENWLNTAAFGYMEHYNISNVAPTESYKMSECNIFLPQPTTLQTYQKDSRRSAHSEVIGLCPALISNAVNVLLSGGSLGYWTACNQGKRYCTLPYSVYIPDLVLDRVKLPRFGTHSNIGLKSMSVIYFAASHKSMNY